MDISKETSEDQIALLTIKGAICITEAMALREEFLACLNQYQGMILNLTQVAYCDTAGVQCLYSACKAAQRTGKHFAITEVSAAVEDALKRIGSGMQEITAIHEEVSNA